MICHSSRFVGMFVFPNLPLGYAFAYAFTRGSHLAESGGILRATKVDFGGTVLQRDEYKSAGSRLGSVAKLYVAH